MRISLLREKYENQRKFTTTTTKNKRNKQEQTDLKGMNQRTSPPNAGDIHAKLYNNGDDEPCKKNVLSIDDETCG